MYPIKFIKGKWIVTKSIDDFVITAYFEISTELYEKIHNYLDKVLQLNVKIWSESYSYDCNIDTSVRNYLTHCIDHAMIRLDIHMKNLTDVILVWNIIIWDLFLIV